MKLLPSVSVVIPAFNSATYIVETLNSVISQTYPVAEIIVVDDGSTDQTYERVAQFHGLVQYVRQERQGVSRARNVGISLANSEFIAFLDADDLWMPDKLMKQIETLGEESSRECVHTNYALLSMEADHWTESPAKWEPAFRNYFSEFIHGRRFRMSSLLASKSCLEDIGGFDEKIPGKYSEDLDLFLKISEKFPIGYVREPIVLYRRHAQSTTATGRARDLAVCDLYVFEAALKRCPDRWRSLANSDRNALYDMAFFAGWNCFEDNDFCSSRRYFLKALKFRPYSVLCWMYYGVTFLPTWLLQGMRKLKRLY